MTKKAQTAKTKKAQVTGKLSAAGFSASQIEALLAIFKVD